MADRIHTVECDGFKATFEDVCQIILVEQLLEKISFWRDIAITHKKSD